MDVIFLQYNGTGDKPATDVARMKRLAGVKVVNSALPRIVIVQVKGNAEKQKLRRFLNWSIGTSKTSKVDIDVDSSEYAGMGQEVNKRLRAIR